MVQCSNWNINPDKLFTWNASVAVTVCIRCLDSVCLRMTWQLYFWVKAKVFISPTIELLVRGSCWWIWIHTTMLLSFAIELECIDRNAFDFCMGKMCRMAETKKRKLFGAVQPLKSIFSFGRWFKCIKFRYMCFSPFLRLHFFIGRNVWARRVNENTAKLMADIKISVIHTIP